MFSRIRIRVGSANFCLDNPPSIFFEEYVKNIFCSMTCDHGAIYDGILCGSVYYGSIRKDPYLVHLTLPGTS